MTRPLATRTGLRLDADPSRVLARLFVPGLELGAQESRATGLLGRILALPEESVAATVAELLPRYEDRHRDLTSVLERHFGQIAHRIPDGPEPSDGRRLLLGACFTAEYAVEGAALFNPSIVAHPDQSGLELGECRFVLSLRAVGEGHLSSVEFRSGVVGADLALRLDDPGAHVESGTVSGTCHDRELLAARLREEGSDDESTRFLLSRLPVVFSLDELDTALRALVGQRLTRHGGARTEELARGIVAAGYEVDFAAGSALAERVLWPHSPPERQGMEDVRLVRFAEPDGRVRYLGTYTAYDGNRVAPHVLETSDFRHFRVCALAGSAARNKGMALFPRQVGGQYLSLARWDRESSSLCTSPDGLVWSDAATVHTPTQPWELIQTGNCGSPLETEAGWLVLTHGVGPMREYALGALLLDLDDPSRVLGRLSTPLMTAGADERDGYVPNVLYSCGGLLHGDQVLLPYGASDASVRFAFLDLAQVLDRLH